MHDFACHCISSNILQFPGFTFNDAVLICFREVARYETLEIKYRKMMEDNNVEKVRSVTMAMDC